jgi:lysophospholipase L1-like esterase
MPNKEYSSPSNRTRWRLIALGAAVFALLQAGFNAYYFFARRGVGIGYYIEKLLAEENTAVEQEPLYRAMREAYLHFNKVHKNVVHVFIGDSITAGFNLHEFEPAGSRPVLNRGIYSDTTDGLISRIETNVNNLTIEKFFLMIGYNDLDLKTDDEILHNIEKILDQAKSERKYLQSILPVAACIEENKNARIAAINLRLAELCRQNGYVFIDLHPHFDVDGELNPQLTYDGIHPNYSGYKLWFDLIEGFLHEG